MQSIGSLLPRAIKKAKLEKGVEAAQVCRLFSQIAQEAVPPEVAKKIKPLYVKNKILVVAVLSSVVAQELQFEQEKIISQINQRLGRPAVAKIKYLL